MEGSYIDWNGSLQIMQKAYESGLFVLVIGPKGTGKTTLVRQFAGDRSIPLDSVNFSLRTRESHLVGTKTLDNGTVGFSEGLLIRSMKNGGILYLDEINAAEADVLIRLDESLDDRRQVVLKESRGEVIRAKKGWFVVGTINPLSHSGTKELPPQLLSRFPVRIRLEYPPPDTELDIIRGQADAAKEPLIQGIRLANMLRQAASVEELFYAPSIRETIAFGKLLQSGMEPLEAARIVFGNVYAQWGDTEYRKVDDIISSIFG